MLLIFICPALQNPYSASRGATKASEPRGGCWRPQLYRALEEKRRGYGRVSPVPSARSPRGFDPPEQECPGTLSSGVVVRARLSVAGADPWQAQKRLFLAARLAHPGHIDFLITTDRFIENK